MLYRILLTAVASGGIHVRHRAKPVLVPSWLRRSLHDSTSISITRLLTDELMMAAGNRRHGAGDRVTGMYDHLRGLVSAVDTAPRQAHIWANFFYYHVLSSSQANGEARDSSREIAVRNAAGCSAITSPPMELSVRNLNTRQR